MERIPDDQQARLRMLEESQRSARQETEEHRVGGDVETARMPNPSWHIVIDVRLSVGESALGKPRPAPNNPPRG